MGTGDLRDWTGLDFVKVGGTLGVLFLAMLGVLVLGRRQSAEYATWVETPCEVVHALVTLPNAQRTADLDHMRIRVVYRYTVDGRTYENEDQGAPKAIPRDLSRYEVHDFLEAGRANGTKDTCSVDPNDPSRSVFRYTPPEEMTTPRRIVVAGLVLSTLLTAFGLWRMR